MVSATQFVAAGVPAAALGADQLLVFLLQLGGLLLLALLFGRVAGRLRMPAIVGELLVGVLIGPSVLGRLPVHLSNWLPQRDPHQLVLLEAVGQLGVLLLVGLTGAHLDLGLLRRRGTAAARISAGSLLVPLGLGVAAGFALPRMLVPGNRITFALFLGVAMCVSAIPVIARILLDLKLQHRNVGQLILIAGMVSDVAGWLLLSVVSVMATSGAGAGQVAWSVAALAVIVLAATTGGRALVRIAMRWAGRAGEATVVVGAAAVLIIGCAAATATLGYEPIVGAFLCGILIGSTGGLPPRLLNPMRTFVLAVLAPVFFALAGLRMDLAMLGKPVVALVGVALLMIATVGKFAGAYVGARLSRLNRWEALALGAGLNARGAVEIIVASVGVKLGVLDTAVYTIVVLVAIVSSLMAAPMLRFAMSRIEQTSDEQLRLAAQEGTAPLAEPAGET